jgi:hypothetical protein
VWVEPRQEGGGEPGQDGDEKKRKQWHSNRADLDRVSERRAAYAGEPCAWYARGKGSVHFV